MNAGLGSGLLTAAAQGAAHGKDPRPLWTQNHTPLRAPPLWAPLPASLPSQVGQVWTGRCPGEGPRGPGTRAPDWAGAGSSAGASWATLVELGDQSDPWEPQEAVPGDAADDQASGERHQARTCRWKASRAGDAPRPVQRHVCLLNCQEADSGLVTCPKSQGNKRLGSGPSESASWPPSKSIYPFRVYLLETVTDRLSPLCLPPSEASEHPQT